jgi:uncharacterized alpha-E superfamily protein
MLSRVSDSLYWMTRYLERAANTAMIVGVHFNLELEQPRDAAGSRWERIFRALHQDSSGAGFLSTDAAVHRLCFDQANRGSIVSAIRSARDNARQVREQISSEMWEQLNRLYHDVRHVDLSDFAGTGPDEFLNSIKDGARLFHGVTDCTMNHGEGWQFIQLGHFLERGVNLASLVDEHFRHFPVTSVGPKSGFDSSDYLEWIGLLKCATAFEAYCKVHTASIVPDRVAEFLLLNETFPHSLRFAADRVETALKAVSELSPSRRANKVLRVAGRLRASLRFAGIDEIFSEGVHVILGEFGRQCGQIHSGIYQAFITYPIEAALEA